MKLETDPITDDEWLLRRIWIDRFRIGKNPRISPDAFAPRTTGRDVDLDGISLYRFSCLDSPERILSTITQESKRHRTGIVRVQALHIRSFGFSILPKFDDRITGHVVIPELNAEAYLQNRVRFAPFMMSLAEIASHSDNLLKEPLRE